MAEAKAEGGAGEDELWRVIDADAARRGVAAARLGYFCVPFRPADGPLADRVIKVYRSLGDRAAAARLSAAHAAYLALLAGAGVRVPATEFRLLSRGPALVPVIVQAALPDTSMMRHGMQREDLAGTLRLMDAAGDVIARFWAAVAGRPERIGFHPSIRNLAVVDGEAVFFDTFPPLIGYSRAEMGRLLLTFSDRRLMRMVGALFRGTVTAIQDEWYSPAGTVTGLVGSACRLRPEHTGAYLDWGRRFARERMPAHAAEIVADLDRPPRLPGYWMAMRRALGLQGQPYT